MIFSLSRWFLPSEKEKKTTDVQVEPEPDTRSVQVEQRQRKRKHQKIQSEDRLVEEDLESDTSDTSKYVKDDVKEVRAGTECGIHLTNTNDYQVGDIIEVYEIHEIRPEL